MTQRIIRIDIPLLIGASLVAQVLSLDNEIGRIDGVVLFAGIVAYTWWLIRGLATSSSMPESTRRSTSSDRSPSS